MADDMGTFFCSECTGRFLTEWRLTLHSQAKHGARCDRCEQWFGSEVACEEHIASIHGYLCYYCIDPKTKLFLGFVKEADLKTHITTCPGRKLADENMVVVTIKARPVPPSPTIQAKLPLSLFEGGPPLSPEYVAPEPRIFDLHLDFYLPM
ncbi:Hypothetical protein POVN_LOCUS303 [uncultured virus]|nr:Hypothetical protein POVN_LOCUS303 [uncultured virus]